MRVALLTLMLCAAAVPTGGCNRAHAAKTNWWDSAAEDNAAEDRDLSGQEASTYAKGGETYEGYDARRDELDGSAGSYAGYGCTEDCSGHEAGYEWAEAHDIADPDDCGGYSWSFEEGCRAYAEIAPDEEAD
jgi:hypothetical protein